LTKDYQNKKTACSLDWMINYVCGLGDYLSDSSPCAFLSIPVAVRINLGNSIIGSRPLSRAPPAARARNYTR
jgi:hypothetical protein